MKRAIIEVTLPELKGGHMYKTARGTGSSSKVAISRAFGDLFKQTRKKHVTVIQARISISEVCICDLCGYEVCRCCEETNKEKE
jgi:hypothetical protein